MPILDKILATIMDWFYKRVLPNPSGQNQITEHTVPHAFFTFLFLSIPWGVGVWAGLIPVVFAIYVEFFRDRHYKDFFKFDDANKRNSDGGADGRADLFFRVLGSAVAYGVTFFWRIFS